MAPLRTVVPSHSHKTTGGWSSSLLVLIIISLCFCGPLHHGTPCILKHFIDGAVWHSYLYVLVVLQWFLLFLGSKPFVKWCEEDVYSNLGPMNWVLSGKNRKYWGFKHPGPYPDSVEPNRKVFLARDWKQGCGRGQMGGTYLVWGSRANSWVTMLTGGSLLSLLLCQKCRTKLLLTPKSESPNPNNISFIS